MGQSEAKDQSLNVLVFGIKSLIDKVEADWRRDQVNSSQDFDLYINVRLIPHVLLWCPREGAILQQTVESLILNIELEGVIYVFYNQPDGDILVHRHMIHWLMSEDAMRQSSLTIVAIIEDDVNSEDYLKQLIESKLSLDQMDSKQARNLILYKFDGKGAEFTKMVEQTIKMKAMS